MYMCAFCEKVKSLDLNRAMFAMWETDDDDNVVINAIECHHCYDVRVGIKLPTVHPLTICDEARMMMYERSGP